MNSIRRFFRNLGPGLITGAADNDPAGISTYSVTGAKTGYGLLWLTFLTLPMTIAVQGMCAKVGFVTRRGLAAVIKQHYPRWVLYVSGLLLVISNVTILAADLLGIAAGFNLLLPQINVVLFVVPVAALVLALELFENYHNLEKVLKFLTILFFSYVLAGFLAHPHWPDALRGTFVPHIELNSQFIGVMVALLGTTITPYLFFWQSSEEVEELHDRHRKSSIKEMMLDVNAGMLFLHLIFYFVILTTAATLFSSGHQITSAADAAEALRPLAGNLSAQLFGVGLIGAGLLALPVLAGSTAFVLAETFGWKEGFENKIRKAPGFYGAIVVSMVLGVSLALSGVNVIDALFYSQVLAGVIAPVLLVLLLLICNNRAIMGDNTNGRFFNIFGWLTVGVMGLTATALFFF